MKSTSPSVSNRPLFVFALPDFPRQHRPSRGGSQPGPAASSGPVRSDPATDLEEWHRPAFWAVRVPNYRCVSESYIFLTCFLPEESCCFQDSFFFSFFFVASPIAFFGPLLVIKGLRPAMFSSGLAIKKKPFWTLISLNLTFISQGIFTLTLQNLFSERVPAQTAVY